MLSIKFACMLIVLSLDVNPPINYANISSSDLNNSLLCNFYVMHDHKRLNLITSVYFENFLSLTST